MFALGFLDVSRDVFVRVSNNGYQEVHKNDQNKDGGYNKHTEIYAIVYLNFLSEVGKEKNPVVCEKHPSVVIFSSFSCDHLVLEEQEIVHCK